jgi:hypothetical protein
MADVPSGYRRIEGSMRHPVRGARLVGPASPDEPMVVSIYLRTPPDSPPLPDHAYWAKTPPGKRKFLSRAEHASLYGATQGDIDQVTKFAASQGLRVIETNKVRRCVVISGTVEQMNKAFAVELGLYESTEQKYRGREDYIYVPEDLTGIIQSVFGLDNRSMVRPLNLPGTAVLTPPWVAQLYRFPTNSAQNQTIGLIELSGGILQSDINAYFGQGPHASYSPLIAPNTPNPFPALVPPTIVDVLVSNGPVSGKNSPGSGSSPGEATLDACVASSVAPGANIVAYWAPNSGMGASGPYATAADWAATITTAVTDSTNNPSVLTICWNGGPENNPALGWTPSEMQTVEQALQEAAALGVTVLTGSGDLGSDDGQNDGSAYLVYPGSSPWVTSCGGTIISQLHGSPPTQTFKENTWSETYTVSGTTYGGATGGGVSQYFPLPPWQAEAGVPQNPLGTTGRGVPDIAGNASVYSGYAIVLGGNDPFPLPTSDGQPLVTGGTSAVVPLYAGLVAILNARLGTRIGFLNPSLYQLMDTTVFNEINDGGNNENPTPGEKTAPSYKSGPNWNPCTGLGSINGTKLLNALVNMATAATPNLYFIVDKNVFGLDEVSVNPSWSNAFWLALEGFSPNQLSLGTPSQIVPILGGAFNNLNGVSIGLDAKPIAEIPGYPDTPQRILFPYQVRFFNAMSFPASGSTSPQLLTGSIQIPGGPPFAEALFELTAGEDPYFSNVGTQNNPPWLSQDLRVFTITAGSPETVINGSGNPPSLTPSTLTDLDPQAGFTFVKALIDYLNQNYSVPTPPNIDPLDTVLPAQSGALTGESSVTPTDPNTGWCNYNFAIARVRLTASAGSPAANSVKVFFRLFLTQTNDTDYQPATTYLSSPDAVMLPGSPSVDSNVDTIPFFASGNYSSPPVNSDYPNGKNTHNIAGNPNGVWTYFGCFLNVYDPNNLVNNQSVQKYLAGTHHCLVAQIAYDGVPIVSTTTVPATTSTSQQLAQRNLQITFAQGSGSPATHRVPQTFDLRPSLPLAEEAGRLLNYPDELMITWGSTPLGSIASVYWPQVSAGDVLLLAAELYETHQLSAADGHTIQCSVSGGATFIPIPPGTGQNFAGLFTVEVPATVRRGQEFDIVVRRIATRQIDRDTSPVLALTAAAARGGGNAMLNWRYVVGTFQVRIPVRPGETLLVPEQNTLAILKWRLEQMSLSNRWYPVLQRYISYIAARVNGLGGNANAILPSLNGYRGITPLPPPACEIREYTGKIAGIVFDRFGDFEGFLLLTERGEERKFHSREQEIKELVTRAWLKRMVISVVVDHPEDQRPVSIVLRRAPRFFDR